MKEHWWPNTATVAVEPSNLTLAPSSRARPPSRASAAHGEHEKRIGEADANWPDWYADYMVRQHARVEPLVSGFTSSTSW